jgi:ferritin-like metal-binding protein YciE
MPDSIQATQIGHNRTGLQTSPLSAEMIDGVQPVTAEAAEASALTEVRLQYIREADPLGSAPPPPTAKGVAKSAAKMLKGERPQAFIDKLAERLAYERGGTRLYDAVIAKFIAHQDELQDASLQELTEIRDEEASHATLIRTCIEQLGADPTAQTPGADLVGVATSGFLQAATDPRTTLVQTLQVALAAELVDVASWQTLIAMAESMGQDGMVERFRKALENENEHVSKVRGWYEGLTLASGELRSAKGKGKERKKQN